MFKLNVDVAVRDLEQESLKEIKEFIWEKVEREEIRKQEEKRLEELLRKKKDTANDVSQQVVILQESGSGSAVTHVHNRDTTCYVHTVCKHTMIVAATEWISLHRGR